MDIKADYEFTADKITYIQYNGNQLTFLIKGQYDSIFTPSFDFDLIINRNIKTKCKSPGLFLTKEGSINCTLTIDPFNNNILESIKDGIEIKENIYRLQRSFNDDKVFKFNIREGDKLEIKDFNLNKGQIFKEKEEDEDKKSEWEIQREIEKRRREKEREEEKKKKDQEELENLLKRRQQVEKEQNKNNNYNPFYTPSEYDKNQNKNNNNFNYPNNNYNNNNNNFFNNQNDDNEQIDYNSNVKLIHLQVRYSYDIIYYMFYALTPIPQGHKIKVGFTISTGGYNYGEFNKINKNIVLKAGESITPDDKSIIVEYYARFECPQCKKLVVDKNNIYGAKVFNIPNDEYLLDAVNINQMGNYLQKNKMENPPLYIAENIFNQNCMLELAGNFFNKNKFFISKFPLTLIGTGYYNSNKNVTVYCNLNEREIFSCPIQENINNFEFKLDQFIINKKDNIIIDNSKITRDRMTFHASCQAYSNYGLGGPNNNNYGGNNPISNSNQNDFLKNSEQMPDILIKKRTNWKKIFMIIASLIISYYLNTLDPRFDYTIEELLQKINTRYNQNILYASIDCCTAKTIRILGINNSIIDRELPDNVKKVAKSISFDPVGDSNGVEFSENLHKSMEDLKPRVLYKVLLKEPKNQEAEISVTEPEERHYTTIVKKHIQEVTKTTTGAIFTEGTKIVNKYVDGKRHIIIVPKNHSSIDLGHRVGTYEPINKISLGNIAFLEIPSIYHIKQICLKQSPPQVEKNRSLEEPEIKQLVNYYRYEYVQITDKFEYVSPALTGDADYDIDMIYNGLDRKDSRGKLSSVFDENLKRIKRNTEIIQLSKQGNKYKIENGRHRIVYLTHMYKTMTSSKHSSIKPEDFKIPAVVIHGIENEELNNLLLTIKNRHRNAFFLKDNINNDDENVIIIIDNKVYRVGNIDELKEFVYSTHQDKYYIGNHQDIKLDYEYIINKIIYILKGEYRQLSLYDIVRIIKQYGVKYDGNLIQTDTLNYLELHRAYMNTIVTLDKNKTFYPEKDELKELERKIKLFDVSREIIRFIENYPSNLELRESELPARLKDDPRFSNYDSSFLIWSIRYYHLDELIAKRKERIPNI